MTAIKGILAKAADQLCEDTLQKLEESTSTNQMLEECYKILVWFTIRDKNLQRKNASVLEEELKNINIKQSSTYKAKDYSILTLSTGAAPSIDAFLFGDKRIVASIYESLKGIDGSRLEGERTGNQHDSSSLERRIQDLLNTINQNSQETSRNQQKIDEIARAILEMAKLAMQQNG